MTHGKKLDLSKLLSKPPEPLPWRVGVIACDGILTVLAGHGGDGKTWATLAFAVGVANGTPVAGIECTAGRAMYVDAENGERLMYDRLRMLGLTSTNLPDGLSMYAPDDGIDFSEPAALEWLRETIDNEKPNLVILDGLKSLAARSEENSNDAMAPIIIAIRDIARASNAAIILLHHRSRAGSGSRGATAIRDQADAQWLLGRKDGDPDHKQRRYLKPDKMRAAAEPETTWLRLEAVGGFMTITKSDPPDGSQGRSVAEDISGQILNQLTAHPNGLSRSDIARGCTPSRHPTDKKVLEALNLLEANGHAIRPPRRGDKWTTVWSGNQTTNQTPKSPDAALVGLVKPLRADQPNQSEDHDQRAA